MFDFDSTARRHAVLTMLGGVCCSFALALDDIAPDAAGIAVVVPVLLGFGVLEVYRRYRERYGTAGRVGVALSGVGLGFLLVAVLLYATVHVPLLAAVVVAIPGVTGLVALALGSALLARVLVSLDVVGLPAALLLGLGLPATPLVGALLAAVAAAFVPEGLRGVVTGFAGAPYGLGWVLVGYRLRQTADTAPHPAERTLASDPSPQLLAALMVGGAFAVLSVGRFLPLGPLSGTPWVNQSLALDVGHLLAGGVALGIAARRDARAARHYNQVVGVLSLLVTGLTLLAVFQDVRSLQWLVRDLLDLNLPDALLHLPAGVVLSVVGFGLDAPPESHSSGDANG